MSLLIYKDDHIYVDRRIVIDNHLGVSHDGDDKIIQDPTGHIAIACVGYIPIPDIKEKISSYLLSFFIDLETGREGAMKALGTRMLKIKSTIDTNYVAMSSRYTIHHNLGVTSIIPSEGRIYLGNSGRIGRLCVNANLEMDKVFKMASALVPFTSESYITLERSSLKSISIEEDHA